mmetsp:Transcript_358/g.762  ORF Transcript_358/g.762 Transcript_358/m.762 type:complete len:195 (+) Transcript_358:959-1543(+)
MDMLVLAHKGIFGDGSGISSGISSPHHLSFFIIGDILQSQRDKDSGAYGDGPSDVKIKSPPPSAHKASSAARNGASLATPALPDDRLKCMELGGISEGGTLQVVWSPSGRHLLLCSETDGCVTILRMQMQAVFAAASPPPSLLLSGVAKETKFVMDKRIVALLDVDETLSALMVTVVFIILIVWLRSYVPPITL